jgi:hypothetical protein
MANVIKLMFFAFLPAVAYVPLLIGTRVLAGNQGVPAWIDWVLLLVSASLVALNPMIRGIESLWLRAGGLVVGFAIWCMVLFISTFFLMALVFSDSL